MNKTKSFLLSVSLTSSLVVSGCTSLPLQKMTQEDQYLNDPFVSLNTKISDFNFAVDTSILKPVSSFYDEKVPSPAKTGINNFISNLNEPTNFLNNLLQLKVGDSITSLSRFAFNSTIGLGGLIDIMSLGGTHQKSEDFGQTLAFWGVKPGSYVVLPFFGPSSVRDLIGRVGDSVVFSPSQLTTSTSQTAGYYILNSIAVRSKLLALDPILNQQSDKYSFLRSSYEQTRLNAVYDGNPPEMKEDF